jgi:hypothetical protein
LTPIKPITMQDVRLIAGEGPLSARTVLHSVNVILQQKGIVLERGAISGAAKAMTTTTLTLLGTSVL